MISTDESADEEEIIRNFDNNTELIAQSDTLPKKSADRYKLVYENYKNWQLINQGSLSSSEETNLVVYFKDLSKKFKPSTLWSLWSMLRKTLYTRENIDITQFYNLKSLVKNNAKGFKPKISSIFKWDEISRFIKTAPDNKHLVSKVILIFGVCGALRCDEISKLKVQDVEDQGKKFIVSINETKNDFPRQFVIGVPFYDRIKQYITMRAKESFTDRFFIKYQNGKFHQQVIGRNKIGETPSAIASHLKLPNPKLYTGHCFRRTGATLLSNSRANKTMLKQLGHWKLTAIAQEYVEKSMKNQEKIYENITHASKFSGTNHQPSTSTDPQPTRPHTFRSSTINIIEAERKITTNDKTSPGSEMECDHFSDEFEIKPEDLLAINQIEEHKPNCRSPTPVLTTANNKETILTNDSQSTKPTHFLEQSPITVFSKNTESTSPGNQTTTIGSGTQHHIKEHESKCFSVNDNTPNIFQNCVFHGDIINNFYYACDHGKNEKKNVRSDNSFI